MLIPYIFKGSEEAARSMVGIYGANIKIAIVMVMFTRHSVTPTNPSYSHRLKMMEKAADSPTAMP